LVFAVFHLLSFGGVFSRTCLPHSCERNEKRYLFMSGFF
jgi:hypothetical protein